jgi:2-isopropylmalate synthase
MIPGIHYIEGGWPGSNPGAARFFALAKNITFKQAKIAAFGATRRPGITCDKDANLTALIDSEAPVITIFGKSWDLHVTGIMDNTLAENLAMIKQSVAHLLAHDREVIYDAEHFFDGYKANRQYALDTLAAALEGGTRTLVLCDTNGGSMPCEIDEIVRSVMDHFKDRPDLFSASTPTTTVPWPWPMRSMPSMRVPPWFRAPSTDMGNGAAMPILPPSFRFWP